MGINRHKWDIYREARDRWAGELCTLDGQPARVLGRRNQFATVATIDNGPAYDWSWVAVDRIMQSTRSFNSK